MFLYESHKAVQDFFRAITSEEKNNKEIEECTVVKILDNILTSNDELTSVLHKGTLLYRAREIETPKAYYDKDCGFNAYFDENNNFHCSGYDYYNSKEPPISIPTSGRNNILGMSYLYLSEDKYTACAEIKPNTKGMISVASFRIEKDLKIMNFYDRVDDYGDIELIKKYQVLPNKIMSEIFATFVRTNKNDKTYLITQFISDYVIKAGYDGIKYWGAANLGTNYTIFNSHKSNVSFVESKVTIVSGVRYDLTDMESQQQIIPTTDKAQCNVGRVQQQIVKYLKEAREKKDKELIINYGD